MNLTASTQCLASLSEAELNQATAYIRQTRDELLGATRLVTPAQWQFIPGPDRWSVGQIVEHVVAVQERVMQMIRQSLADAPAPPAGQDSSVVDRIVIQQFPNRLEKFASPFAPESRFDQAGAIRRYADNCAALSDMVASTPGLREHVLDSPPLKAVSKGAYSVMDGYQWLLVAASHAERHTKQILEVIADSSFPV